MKETPEEFAKRYWNSLAPHYSEHRKTLAYFIAEHDAELTAEICKECADRAIAFVIKEAAGILLEDCYIKIDPDQLRAAIEGKKEGEE